MGNLVFVAGVSDEAKAALKEKYVEYVHKFGQAKHLEQYENVLRTSWDLATRTTWSRTKSVYDAQTDHIKAGNPARDFYNDGTVKAAYDLLVKEKVASNWGTLAVRGLLAPHFATLVHANQKDSKEPLRRRFCACVLAGATLPFSQLQEGGDVKMVEKSDKFAFNTAFGLTHDFRSVLGMPSMLAQKLCTGTYVTAPLSQLMKNVFATQTYESLDVAYRLLGVHNKYTAVSPAMYMNDDHGEEQIASCAVDKDSITTYLDSMANSMTDDHERVIRAPHMTLPLFEKMGYAVNCVNRAPTAWTSCKRSRLVNDTKGIIKSSDACASISDIDDFDSTVACTAVNGLERDHELFADGLRAVLTAIFVWQNSSAIYARRCRSCKLGCYEG